MHNWDFFRKQADTFDIDYELSRFNEATIKPYRETIKELKKLYKFPAIMRLNTHRLRRRMLIPKENARQRAIPDGIFSAIKDAIEIFKIFVTFYCLLPLQPLRALTGLCFFSNLSSHISHLCIFEHGFILSA